MSANPYHNQHIQEYAAAMEEAVGEITRHYDGILMNMLEKQNELAVRIEKLEQEKEKPLELEANVKLNPQSVRDIKAQIMNLFRW